jgi:ABC-type sugar transport system substrate-binding protein
LAGKILIAGMDCDMMVMEKIKEGVVDNSIWQDGLGQGENALRIAMTPPAGKKYPTI